MTKSPYEPPPIPEALRHLPPAVAKGLHALGYSSLEAAGARLRQLSRVFANMSDGKHTTLAGLASFNSTVRMTEKDFGLFAFMAAVGYEVLTTPQMLTIADSQKPDLAMKKRVVSMLKGFKSVDSVLQTTVRQQSWNIGISIRGNVKMLAKVETPDGKIVEMKPIFERRGFAVRHYEEGMIEIVDGPDPRQLPLPSTER